ncbi:MAG: hypothetical protein L0Y56_21545, partial [Nitrospira sp.]|nr:hypothetical protein [Nitrospira sp.]
PPDPRIEVASLRAKTQQLKIGIDSRLKALKQIKDAELTEAKIVQLKATAAKLLAEAGDVAPGREMEAIRLQIEGLESQEKRLREAALFLRDLIPDPEESSDGQAGPAGAAQPGGVDSVEGAPDNVGSTGVPGGPPQAAIPGA